MRKGFAAALILACCLSPLAAQAQSADTQGRMQYPLKACPKIVTPDALRTLAQQCARDLRQDANCRAHVQDGAEDYVIVKDCSPQKPQGYLIIPVKPVTGIDDSNIFSPSLANLWEDARLWSEKYPGEPAARTGLAINSKNARSQNQLHIHIACVLPKVSEALESASIPFAPATPVTLQLGPEHNAYKAVKVKSLAGGENQFGIVQSMPGVAGDMKDQSIAVVGSQKPGEYYVLDTTASGANRGHAEELLEQTCAPGAP